MDEMVEEAAEGSVLSEFSFQRTCFHGRCRNEAGFEADADAELEPVEREVGVDVDEHHRRNGG